jgi:hypothetical protein
MCGYPAMACVSSAQEMTEAERECCKHMAQPCGSMDMSMPGSHSCCRTEVRQPQSMLLAANTHIAPPIALHAVSFDVPNRHLAVTAFAFFQLHPPPESPPGSSSILRI